MAFIWIFVVNSLAVLGNRIPTYQDSALVQSVASMMKVKTSTHQDDDHIDHVDGHIVCYSQDCSEAQATLEVYTTRATDAQRKLDECAVNREQLQSNLAGAAEERATVAAALEECGRERQDLQSQLEDCGAGRAMLEQELAKCARERSILEEELRQCAEVDRPAAEEALAKCAEERAALEEELEQLAQRLEERESGEDRHRRRRRSSRRASSLIQEADNLSVEMSTLQVKLKNAKEAEAGAQERLDKLLAKLDAAMEKIGTTDGQLNDIFNKVEALNVNGTGIMKKIKKIEAEFKAFARAAKKADREIAKAAKEGLAASEEEEKAIKTLAADTNAVALAQVNLLSLVHSKVEKRETNLKAHEEKFHEKVKALQAMLATKEKEGREEECAALRVEVIKTRGNLELFSSGLAECLESKKIISEKIQAADKAREHAQKALNECLAAKARLQAALDECHDRCEQTSALLEECLSRKEELQGLIDECHSRRDAARESLQQCLEQKEELKERIEELRERLGTASLLSLSDNNRQDGGLSNGRIIDAVANALKEFTEDLENAVARESEETAAVVNVLKAGDKQTEAVVAAAADLKQAAAPFNAALEANARKGEAISHLVDEERKLVALNDAAAETAEANIKEIKQIESEASGS